MKRFCAIVFLSIVFAVFLSYASSFIEAKRKPRWSDANSFFNNKISRRENWIELYGLAQRAFGKRQIDNFTLYKTSYGKIVQIQKKISDEEINTKLKELFPIINHLNSLGTPCYYITSLLPVRDIKDIPAGVVEWSHSNQQRLLKKLNDCKVNTINLDCLSQIKKFQKKDYFIKQTIIGH